MTRDWRDLAACLDEDPRLFAATDPRSIRVARTICHGCPVMLTCRAAAVGETACVWGGQDADERAAWARAEAGLEACADRAGTAAGYNRHRRAGQDSCPECRAAKALQESERRSATTRTRSRITAASEDIEARRRQVRILAVEQGMPDTRIADVLGVSERTVLRDRQATGIPPAHPECANRRAVAA